jgi:DNA repair exonuclease SbcCD ATPase subunit
MIGKQEISLLREKYLHTIAEKKILTSQLNQNKKDLVENEDHLLNCQKARTVVQIVAEETQKKIEYQVSNLVSLALASVFLDPYEFKLKFVMRRNKTEADMLFIKNGHEGNPIEIAGGGALDVASFALRAAIWSIKPTNNVLIQDEPFHFLSRNLQNKCSQMIKKISQKLGIQFIIVSHIPEITDAADKVFNVSYEDGISKITEK